MVVMSDRAAVVAALNMRILPPKDQATLKQWLDFIDGAAVTPGVPSTNGFILSTSISPAK